MAIAYQSSASNSVNGATNTIAINKPSGTVSGDFLLAFITEDTGSSATLTPPAGWTAVQAKVNRGTNIGQGAYWLVAGGSEPTSYTFTGSGTAALDGGILRFTGVDTTSPIDVFGSTTGASATETSASVTMTSPGDMVVVGWSINSNVSPSSDTSGMTNAVNQHSSTSNAIYINYLAETNPGSTGTFSVTYAASHAYVTQIVALRPANVSPSITDTTFGADRPSLPDLSYGTESIITEAWIYPGPPACNAPFEYSDGRHIDILKPEYYILNNDGTITLLTVGNNGCDAYNASNAIDIKKYSSQQFITVSGGQLGMEAIAGSSTLTSTFISTITTFLTSNGFTGVELDWEDWASWTAADWTLYKSFLNTVGTALHGSGLKLMITGPAIATQADQSFYVGWFYEDLNSMPVDYIVPLAYDYQFANGSGFPVAPQFWIIQVCQWVQARITDWTRIVIGLNSYGYHGATGTFSITLDTYTQSSGYTGFGTATREQTSGEMTWVNAGITYFFSDQQTLNMKMETVLSTGLRHISVWHLGGNLWFSFSGSQAAQLGTITVSITDARTGTDTATSVVSTTVTDSATGSETSSVVQQYPLPIDPAIGMESFSASATVPVTDSSTALDAASPSITLPPITDSGTGSETPSLGTIAPSITNGNAATAETLSFGTVAPALSDSGTALDNAAILNTIAGAVANTGTGTDTPTVGTVTPSILDSSLGTESTSLSTVSSAESDAGTGSEAISQIMVTPPLSADTATGGDSASLGTVGVPLPNGGAGQETVTLGTVTSPETDSATGSELLGFGLVTEAVPDSGSGAQTAAIGTVSPSIVDSGAAQDQETTGTISPAVTDSGTGVDTVTVNYGTFAVPITDAGSGSDTPALATNVAVPLTDARSGSESVSLGTVTPSIPDAGAASDSAAVLATNVGATDNGTGVETPTLGTISPAITNGAVGSPEVISTAASVPVSDGATGAEAIAFTQPSTIPVTDSGTGAETVAKQSLYSVLDAGSGAPESIQLTVGVPITDSAVGTEQEIQDISLTTSGVGTESVGVGIPVTDTATGSDSTVSVAVFPGTRVVQIRGSSGRILVYSSNGGR